MVIADIDSQKGKSAEEELSNLGGDVLFLEIDVTQEASQARVFQDTIER